MPEMDGLELLRLVKSEHPQLLVIMITAYGSIESAIESMKRGADDYLLKPFDPEQLMILIEKMVQQRALLEENQTLKDRLAEQTLVGMGDLITASPAMRPVLDLIQQVSAADTPVLISGETGTGKELVARAIHTVSARAYAPFVTINCGAQPEALLESELFGHERGAFTGAVKTRRGRLEMADEGTLFLDEIGEIPSKMQVDLLRVLEEKTFHRVGGTSPVLSDFRLISATHRDLSKRIQEGTFRQDFFYRIAVITIPVPPLRNRPEDIPLLAKYFLDRFSRETGKKIEAFSPQALDILSRYPWPGNVRELKNVIERSVVIGKSRLIGPNELTFLIQEGETTGGPVTLRALAEKHIRRTLESQDWNISQAARILGMDRSTLSRQIRQYGIKRSLPHSHP
jgi:two-component system response regulator HydG